MSATGSGTEDPRCTTHPEVTLVVCVRDGGVGYAPGAGRPASRPHSRTRLFRFLGSGLIVL